MYNSSQTTVILIMVVLYFVFLLGQGFYFRRRTKSADEFVTARNIMPFFPLVLSILGTASGGSTLLGITQTSYNLGFGYIWIQFPAFIIMIIMNVILVKPIRNVGNKYKLSTIPDFVALRYGEKLRIPAAMCIVFAFCAITGLQYIAIATFLNLMLGLNASIGIIVGFLLLSIKSYFGGLRAVIWSDTIQGTIQTLGIFALLAIGLIRSGGWGSVVANAAAAGVPEFTSFFNVDILEVLMFTLTIGAYQFLRQDQWQRIWAGKTGKTAFVSQWTSTAINIAVGFAVTAIGVLAKYGLFLEVPSNSNVFYSMINNLLPFGFQVVILVVLMATIVSCGDSFQLVSASSISNDILKPILKPKDDEQLLKHSRYSVFIAGTVACVLALSIPNLVKLWTVGTAMLTSGLMIPVICGFYWKRATNAGALASCLGGFGIALLWQILGAPMGLHPVFPGVAISLVLMVIVSLVTKRSPQEVVDGCYYKSHNTI